MRALVLAEHKNQQLAVATCRALTAATEITDTIDVLVVGESIRSVAEELAHCALVTCVHVLDSPVAASQYPEFITETLLTLASQYDYFLAPATGFGKDIMPRFAARLGVAQISDVLDIVSTDTFVRPIYAGDVLQTVRSHDLKKVLTIQPTAFAPIGTKQEQATIQPLTLPEFMPNKETLFVAENQSDRPELQTAKVVVAGGRGLKDAESFELLEVLADKLNAAVGATRAAVDAGLASNDCQVGQTGKTVAPELYFAFGISGALQHLAGMKQSKTIVAINRDPDSPIFSHADYGLVGDAKEIILELINALE